MSVEVAVTSEEEVEGQMNLPGNVPTGITRKGASLEFNTLDEPIKDTFVSTFIPFTCLCLSRI
jgi:hypothetical protein